MSKPLILITNDDGFNAKGLMSMVDAVKDFGEILIVAPDKPQSGMGHAITVNDPLRYWETNQFKNLKAYCCTGTPVDCIKMGMYLLKDRKPDYILSGINHGSNVSSNVLYSGTMSAAIEGALEGIPSIGFSLTSYDPDANFNPSINYLKAIFRTLMKNNMKKGTCLNVNIPAVEENEIMGVKVCKQGRAFWDDTFDQRADPLGNKYYWLTGSFGSKEKDINSDIYYLENNYITVVPTQFDMTCYESIKEINKWKLDEI